MRIASALCRLLLFALIVLGTAGMHTIGHPPQAGAASAGAASEGTASEGTASARAHDAAAPCPDGHCPAPASPTVGAGAGGHGMPAQHHGGAMDPMSLCLAVALAAFVLAVTGYALRRQARERTRRARGAWGRLVSGLPPPRPPELSRLVVLRI